ncbi:GDSL-like Lipase/Acylhydrolase family protein [Rhodococcus triatomae]|uniref:GDSL-like Lipase/Acylhydrolase family protein n=1 Tax=Rhodococcus triatomae TaxID=300028 RepID=A0A1G8SHH9_9NOCA|nr:GDSL-like Lipase/Acylhydrolase family protein [Rhodococcus triatomae]
MVGGAAFVAVGTVTHAAADPVEPEYLHYVAMGDSFTNGAPIPPLDVTQDSALSCSPSAVNYPHLVAESLEPVRFDDRSCGGARTADLTGGAQPQYAALTEDTDLVTVGIGGNDIGLVGLANSCTNPFPEGTPGTVSCAERATAGGRDVYGESITAFAPRYGEIVDEIRSASPRARIVFVGYPTGIRSGGCFPAQPIWPRDADYLQDRIDQLTDVMRASVTAAGAEFVSLRESTVGHDACAVGADRWIEGLVPTDIAAPLHPNRAGHENAAAQVLAALR